MILLMVKRRSYMFTHEQCSDASWSKTRLQSLVTRASGHEWRKHLIIMNSITNFGVKSGPKFESLSCLD